MSIARQPPRALALTAVLVAMAFAMACTAGPAQADVGEQIIRRCTHGQSLSGFSQAAYRQALEDMSAGTEEYSNCAQLIRQAQLAAAAGGAPGGSAGLATPGAQAIATTPQEQAAIAQAPNAGGAPVQVGGQTVHPGVVHVDVASALSSLPTPLLATVAFLVLCLLLALGAGVRNRVRARRGQ
jgi:hypothetical protein